MTTYHAARLSYWRLKLGPRGEELARINACADVMGAYRKTEEYRREHAKWMEFINAGRELVKSGTPGVIVR